MPCGDLGIIMKEKPRKNEFGDFMGLVNLRFINIEDFEF